MIQLPSPALLEKYLTLYRIPELFDTPNLPFSLYEYESGELLNYVRPLTSYLKFVVDGEIRIYTLSEDGSTRLVYQGSPFSLMLGDLEFGGTNGLSYCYEAVTTVRCVELTLGPYQQRLLNDNRFLRYLVEGLVAKLSHFAGRETSLDTTVENRLLYYFRHEARNQRFVGVEALAFRLHCSRSQIQRALRNLQQQGIIQRIKKGEYALTGSIPEEMLPPTGRLF